MYAAFRKQGVSRAPRFRRAAKCCRHAARSPPAAGSQRPRGPRRCCVRAPAAAPRGRARCWRGGGMGGGRGWGLGNEAPRHTAQQAHCGSRAPAWKMAGAFRRHALPILLRQSACTRGSPVAPRRRCARRCCCAAQGRCCCRCLRRCRSPEGRNRAAAPCSCTVKHRCQGGSLGEASGGAQHHADASAAAPSAKPAAPHAARTLHSPSREPSCASRESMTPCAAFAPVWSSLGGDQITALQRSKRGQQLWKCSLGQQLDLCRHAGTTIASSAPCLFRARLTRR